MPVQKFKTKLKKMGSWTIAPAPIDVHKVFGTKKHVRTKGSIDGFSFKGISLMPMGDGTHFLAVSSSIRKAIKKESGDTVQVILEKDTAEMALPPELQEALEASPVARSAFEKYSYSHKKNYITYITEAKKEETRAKRAVDVIMRIERSLTGI
jgi:hypothetical protein